MRGASVLLTLAANSSLLLPLPRMQYVLVQANVTGSQFPYQMYSYLPFIPWEVGRL